MLQGQQDEVDVNFVMYEILQKVDFIKLLQLADLLITLQLIAHDLNLIALEMYSYQHNWSSYSNRGIDMLIYWVT